VVAECWVAMPGHGWWMLRGCTADTYSCCMGGRHNCCCMAVFNAGGIQCWWRQWRQVMEACALCMHAMCCTGCLQAIASGAPSVSLGAASSARAPVYCTPRSSLRRIAKFCTILTKYGTPSWDNYVKSHDQHSFLPCSGSGGTWESPVPCWPRFAYMGHMGQGGSKPGSVQTR
jgi:hypothetical protein